MRRSVDGQLPIKPSPNPPGRPAPTQDARASRPRSLEYRPARSAQHAVALRTSDVEFTIHDRSCERRNKPRTDRGTKGRDFMKRAIKVFGLLTTLVIAHALIINRAYAQPAITNA